MITHNIQIHNKMSLNIYFLKVSEEFRRVSKTRLN